MITATANFPRALIERVYASDVAGRHNVPAADRLLAVGWLRRALVDFDSLDQHIALLQELAGTTFSYPRPRRDRWPDAQPSGPDSTGFGHAALLSPERLEAVLDRGPDVLSDLELADLLINPFALFDTFDAIDETQPDFWIDEMSVVGREVTGPAVTVPRPAQPVRLSRAAWAVRVAALAACLLVGVLVGRFTRPDGGDSESAASRRQLEVAREELTELKKKTPLSGPLARGATEMQSSLSDRKLPLRRIWNANYVAESSSVDNLQRLMEAGPVEIREFVANQRKAGLADFEILTLLKQAVDQSPKE